MRDYAISLMDKYISQLCAKDLFAFIINRISIDIYSISYIEHFIVKYHMCEEFSVSSTMISLNLMFEWRGCLVYFSKWHLWLL